MRSVRSLTGLVLDVWNANDDHLRAIGDCHLCCSVVVSYPRPIQNARRVKQVNNRVAAVGIGIFPRWAYPEHIPIFSLLFIQRFGKHAVDFSYNNFIVALSTCAKINKAYQEGRNKCFHVVKWWSAAKDFLLIDIALKNILVARLFVQAGATVVSHTSAAYDAEPAFTCISINISVQIIA